MSDDEEESKGGDERGIPAWVMTFADLMSLLMCFFVLLLAFSEMDAQNYKRLAGSMAEAFGVQNRIQVNDIPKGTSIIAQEFAPGRPEPTPIKSMNQHTMERTKTMILMDCKTGEIEGHRSEKSKGQMNDDAEKKATPVEIKQMQKAESDAEKIKEAVAEQVKGGKIEVETRGKKVIIRIKENGSFPSGSATLRPEFLPIMEKIRLIIKDIPGLYHIEGHSDDVPISTARFRSNWELSASRAVSVAHELFKNNALPQSNAVIIGLADTKPLVPNVDRFNRAKNRRVEIIIEQQPEVDEEGELYDTDTFIEEGDEFLKEVDPKKIQKQIDAIEEKKDLDETIRKTEAREAPQAFEFSPDEIF